MLNFKDQSLEATPEAQALLNLGSTLQSSAEDYGTYGLDLFSIVSAHSQRMFEAGRDTMDTLANGNTIPAQATPNDLMEYLADFGRRSVLFLEVLHNRSKKFLEHEAGGKGTVLIWDHEIVMDGETLARPVNYCLVRIIPPKSAVPIPHARPYIIIDPRAGHGSGIGGFKHESEVGCAVNAGHPVYFVTFSRLPAPGQTLSDVCAAEAEFVREVKRRHPSSPKPIIVGNCQGGWAAMLVAATHPDITGPVVANGSPLSYWAGIKGKNPLRYLGGVSGGVLPALILSDLGNGLFDGANLVSNFERLNPSKTWWQKYYNLFANVDKETDRFLEFEGWWNSFYFMNEQEIRWILDNLFIGNKLARGQANLDESTHVDLRNIQSPVIIFASHGDNITPPQQALGWIADTYKDVEEIRTRGARILYTLHPNVGHLGIFVSSEVARVQHQEIVSTLDAIEALSPGLYEMTITSETGEGLEKQFSVAFEERDIPQVMAQAGGIDDPRAFAAAARFSDLTAEVYEMTARPFVKAMVSKSSADALAAMHPLRAVCYALSDRNPLLAGLPALAGSVRNGQKPLDPQNPFIAVERFTADMVSQWWDGMRNIQDFGIEMYFNWVFNAPAVKTYGELMSRRISDSAQEDLRSLPSVRDALDRIAVGGFPEGVIRMLVLLAHSRHEVRRSRLEKSNQILSSREPFASMKAKHRTRLIYRESLISAFEPEAALETLPKLLKTREEREQAMSLCWEIAGPQEEMVGETLELMATFSRILGIEAADLSIASL